MFLSECRVFSLVLLDYFLKGDFISLFWFISQRASWFQMTQCGFDVTLFLASSPEKSTSRTFPLLHVFHAECQRVLHISFTLVYLHIILIGPPLCPSIRRACPDRYSSDTASARYLITRSPAQFNSVALTLRPTICFGLVEEGCSSVSQARVSALTDAYPMSYPFRWLNIPLTNIARRCWATNTERNTMEVNWNLFTQVSALHVIMS